MREVSISQLWSRAWDLFKMNWLLLVGLLVLAIIVNAIIVNFIRPNGALIMKILLKGALIMEIPLLIAPVQAGYLVARQGQSSFGEAFRDISLLQKVFAYYLILGLTPGILIAVGYILVRDSAETGGILVVAGLIILFISYLFGWAGPYAILSGRAGIFGAIGQSFSLTAQNFEKVFLALISYIGLLIFVYISGQVVSLQWFYNVWILMGYLIVVPIGFVFLPLLYFALTDEEGVSHSKSLHLG
jgi:hypothetical protein